MRKFVLAVATLASMAAPALAANANHPYQNCDKRIDNCGPTGNDQTDRLNQQQLGGAPTSPAPSADPGMPSGQTR